MDKICAVIPAYNEEKALTLLLKKIKNYHLDVILIDDGSADKTAAAAKSQDAYLIRHPLNRGKGSALRDGFQFALEKDYDLIITLDADGQHNPAEIPSFINKISESNAAIIAGNRLHFPKGMPLYRLFINKLFSKITSMVSKQNIPDAACGYRIIKKEVLRSISLNSNGFDIDFEILIKSAKAGFRIDFINIDCIYGGESSYIRPLRYWSAFFRLIIKELRNN